MKSRASFFLILGLIAAAAVVVAPVAGQGRQGPGIQAPDDAREPELLKTCKVPPPPASARGAGAGRAGGPTRQGGAAAPSGPQDVTSTAIPGVIAAGQKWTLHWTDKGNNGDGIVVTDDGSILIARNDKSDVVRVDANDRASVIYTDTNTGGTLGMNTKGELFVAARGYKAAILQLAPTRRIVSNKYGPDNDWWDCIGGNLHDLSPDRKGGIYVAIGAPVLYIDPSGKTTKYGDENLRGNGIILSHDEKRLYVTNSPSIVAFDVQPDGSVRNQRDFARLEAGGNGDGMAVDATGRLYVTSAPGVQVFTAAGKYLGLIPTPRAPASVAFTGPGKKTLYVTGSGALGADGKEIVTAPGVRNNAKSIFRIPMLAEGFKGRPK